MARNKIVNGPANAARNTAPAAPPPSAENPNPQLGGPENTIVERASDPIGEGKLQQAAMPGMRGGSYGVIPEAEKRVNFFGAHMGGTARKAPPTRKPKTFVVVGPINAPGGRISFVYDHQRVSVLPGKEVTENAYDLDILRKQGIRLEEVVDPIAEEQPVLEAVEDAPDSEETKEDDAEDSADA